MSYRRYNVSQSSGNFTGQTSGSTMTPGVTLHIGESQQDIAFLSARLSVTCVTTGATIGCKWQGSSDGSTWDDIANAPNNPAATVLVTGTGTALAATKAIGAPDAVYGYKYARAVAVLTSTTAGLTTDLWAMGYTYRQLQAGEHI
jgi:hypothetical protein